MRYKMIPLNQKVYLHLYSAVKEAKGEPAMASLTEYEEELKTAKVRVEVIDGINHLEEFTEIDRGLPLMLAFMANEI